ncbi:MAG: hypothetical protein AB7E47_06825 [Desulfovibrionaceae bacterium]
MRYSSINILTVYLIFIMLLFACRSYAQNEDDAQSKVASSYEELFPAMANNDNAFFPIASLKSSPSLLEKKIVADLSLAAEYALKNGVLTPTAQKITEKYSTIENILTNIANKKHCTPPLHDGSIEYESISRYFQIISNYIVLKAFQAVRNSDDDFINAVSSMFLLFNISSSYISSFPDFVVSTSILTKCISISNWYLEHCATRSGARRIAVCISSLRDIQASYARALNGDLIRNMMQLKLVMNCRATKGTTLTEENVQNMNNTVLLQSKIVQGLLSDRSMPLGTLADLVRESNAITCTKQLPVCSDYILPRPDFPLSLEASLRNILVATLRRASE